MCSVCRSLGFQFRQNHPEETCPYTRACYCSYCGLNGHTTGNCPNGFCNDSVCSGSCSSMDEYDLDTDVDLDTNKSYRRAINHRPCLEVIDDESNIRAFLISFGIPLSGKPEKNRENLIHACKYHNPPLQLFWLDQMTGNSRLHVDDPQPQKSTRGRKKKNQAQ